MTAGLIAFIIDSKAEFNGCNPSVSILLTISINAWKPDIAVTIEITSWNIPSNVCENPPNTLPSPFNNSPTSPRFFPPPAEPPLPPGDELSEAPADPDVISGDPAPPALLLLLFKPDVASEADSVPAVGSV